MPRSGSLTKTYRGADSSFGNFIPTQDSHDLPAIKVTDDFFDLNPSSGALMFKTQTGFGVWQGLDRGWQGYSNADFNATFVQAVSMRPGQLRVLTLTYKIGPMVGMNVVVNLSFAQVEAAARLAEQIFVETPLNA